jgi:hypothetical protein
MKYQVQILRMVESSGNNQFFVYAVDTEKDNKDIFNSNKLNFSCHQSKYFDFKNKEPLERATYDAMQLLNFFNLSKHSLQLPSDLTDEELSYVENSFKFWRFER